MKDRVLLRTLNTHESWRLLHEVNVIPSVNKLVTIVSVPNLKIHCNLTSSVKD